MRLIVQLRHSLNKAQQYLTVSRGVIMNHASAKAYLDKTSTTVRHSNSALLCVTDEVNVEFVKVHIYTLCYEIQKEHITIKQNIQQSSR